MLKNDIYLSGLDCSVESPFRVLKLYINKLLNNSGNYDKKSKINQLGKRVG